MNGGTNRKQIVIQQLQDQILTYIKFMLKIGNSVVLRNTYFKGKNKDFEKYEEYTSISEIPPLHFLSHICIAQSLPVFLPCVFP